VQNLNPRNTGVFTTQGIGFAGTSGLNISPALTLDPIEGFETTSMDFFYIV